MQNNVSEFDMLYVFFLKTEFMQNCQRICYWEKQTRYGVVISAFSC